MFDTNSRSAVVLGTGSIRGVKHRDSVQLSRTHSSALGIGVLCAIEQMMGNRYWLRSSVPIAVFVHVAYKLEAFASIVVETLG